MSVCLEKTSSPNTSCFSCRWLLLCTRKSAPKKLRNNFFHNKLYSLKAHGHYSTVLIYLATSRAAKLGTFTHFTFTNLPWYNQSINSLIYVYCIQIPSCFFWVFNNSCDHTFSYYSHQKNFLFCPLNLDRFFHSFLQHYFNYYKPQILAKQTGLTNRFIISIKNLCRCIQKIKIKHDGGADVLVLF